MIGFDILNNKSLISNGKDEFVRIYDIETGNNEFELEIESLSFCPPCVYHSSSSIWCYYVKKI